MLRAGSVGAQFLKTAKEHNNSIKLHVQVSRCVLVALNQGPSIDNIIPRVDGQPLPRRPGSIHQSRICLACRWRRGKCRLSNLVDPQPELAGNSLVTGIVGVRKSCHFHMVRMNGFVRIAT